MQIGDWQVDLDTGTLVKIRIHRQLTPRSLQVLKFLVAHPNKLVASDTLLAKFWRGPLSAENALQKSISELRRAFGDKPRNPAYLQTVNKQGYILIAPLKWGKNRSSPSPNPDSHHKSMDASLGLVAQAQSRLESPTSFSVAAAHELLLKALTLDPNCVNALTQLVRVYLHLTVLGESWWALSDGALQFVDRAETLGGQTAQVLITKGILLQHQSGDEKAAAELFQQALLIEPDNEMAQHRHMQMMQSLGQTVHGSKAELSAPGIQPLKADIAEQSIGILPFTNLGKDPENRYLCDGIAEELIFGLTKVDGLRVASQLSGFGANERGLTTQEIGARLKVTNVLSGSIQESGTRVRITVVLEEVTHGTLLWSERFDGSLEDVFELQENVANKVIESLKIEWVTPPDQALIDSGTRSVKAYNSFLLGTHEGSKASPKGYLKAHSHFASAIDADPGFGRAYWQDFMIWISQRQSGLVTTEGLYAQAKLRVQQMKLTGFEAHIPDVWIERILGASPIPNDKTLADEAIKKVKHWDDQWRGYEFDRLGASLISAGLLNGALAYWDYYFEHYHLYAIQGDIYFKSARLLTALGRFDRAIEYYSNMIQKNPSNVSSYGYRAMVYSRTGQHKKAQTDLEILSKTFPKSFMAFYDLWCLGDISAARAYLNPLKRRKGFGPVQEIWSCFLLGDIEEGIDHLEHKHISLEFIRLQVLSLLTPSIVDEVTTHPEIQGVVKLARCW